MVAFYIPGMTNELLGTRRTVPVEPVAAPSAAPVISLAPTTAPAATSSTARIVNIPGLGVIDIAAQQAAAQQAAAQQAEAQRIAEAQRLAAQQAEAQRIAEVQRAAAQQAAAQQAEAQRLAAQQAAAQQAEAQRVAAQQAEAQRIAAQQAEAQRIAEAQRVAAQQAEAQRLAAQQAEAQRVAAQRATPSAPAPAAPAAPAGVSKDVWQTVLQNAGPQAVARLAAAEQAATPAPTPTLPAPVAAPAAAPEAAPLSAIAPQAAYVPGLSSYLEQNVAPASVGTRVPDESAITPISAATVVPAAPAPAGSPLAAAPSNIDLSGIDLSGVGYEALGLPASYTPQPNYLVKPTKDLDPVSVALQTVDGTQGLQFVTNKGNAASIREKELGKKGATETSTGFVPLVEDAQYRFINEKGKDQVLYTGTGEEGLKNVYAMAQDLSATKGKKANWGVEMLDPATGEWSRVADDDPAKKWTSVAGDILGAALPIATAFVPGLNVLGSVLTPALAGAAGAAISGKDPLKGAVMGGLSAAGGQLLGPALQGAGIGANVATAIGTGLGTTAGGLATGQNLQNALLGGVAAGGLSYLGGEVFGPKGGTQTGANAGQSAADTVGQTVGQQAGEQLGGLGDIVVTAAGRGLAPNLGALTSALGGSAGNLLMNQLPGSTGSQPVREAPSLEDLNQIVVTATPQTPPVNLGTVNLPINTGGSATSNLPVTKSPLEQAQQQLEQQAADENQIVVTAKPQTPPVNLGTVNLPIGGGTVSQTSPTLENTEVTVTAKPEEPATLGTTVLPVGSPIVPPLTPPSTPPSNQQTTDAAKEEQVDKGTTLDDIISYLRLGGLGLGLIGDLVGGGGGGSTGTDRIPAGLFGGSRAPVFGASLPAPNMPGLASTAGPRTAADLGGQGLASPQDYYRYGYGPEQSFRSNIAAAPRNTSTAYTGYAEGGEVGFAVGGPGDGRDDKIPAMLSDGEYVIDAETVAMLGNGSTKAGADALDEFRVNIRKHKGRALSKGEFSANAKKPEQYLKKGRH